MQVGILIKIVLPLALFIIMLGMGFSLTTEDFKRILKQPRAVMVGVFCQMLLLPIIAYLVIVAFNPPPVLGVGLMILSFCPGGTTSNMISYLAKADLALSVTLTAIVSILTPLTIPFLTKLTFISLMGNEQAFELPIISTMLKLFAITVLPVGIGMLVNKKFPNFAQSTESPIKFLSLAFLFIVIAGIAKQNWANLPDFFRQIGPAALVLNVTTMILGFLIAKKFKLSHKQGMTIG
ncbi:MAG: bile acid:sodium symporter family protein, partial [Halobacteriovoraceae bacterium]|nr:bile acid:sodium symporter family protein [Halobacteriovoraceae bacterium]